jgi:hypothetical protein
LRFRSNRGSRRPRRARAGSVPREPRRSAHAGARRTGRRPRPRRPPRYSSLEGLTLRRQLLVTRCLRERNSSTSRATTASIPPLPSGAPGTRMAQLARRAGALTPTPG